jgi:hypothetical protein
MQITSYYIDNNNKLHAYIGESLYVTISEVYNEEQAESIIDELNGELTTI